MLLVFSRKNEKTDKGISKNKVISDKIIAAENSAAITPRILRRIGLIFK